MLPGLLHEWAPISPQLSCWVGWVPVPIVQRELETLGLGGSLTDSAAELGRKPGGHASSPLKTGFSIYKPEIQFCSPARLSNSPYRAPSRNQKRQKEKKEREEGGRKREKEKHPTPPDPPQKTEFHHRNVQVPVTRKGDRTLWFVGSGTFYCCSFQMLSQHPQVISGPRGPTSLLCPTSLFLKPSCLPPSCS